MRGEMRSDVKSDIDEAAECQERFLKAFLHPSPPLERKSRVGIAGFMIQKASILSIPKMSL
jgi:hypothetical protein